MNLRALSILWFDPGTSRISCWCAHTDQGQHLGYPTVVTHSRPVLIQSSNSSGGTESFNAQETQLNPRSTWLLGPPSVGWKPQFTGDYASPSLHENTWELQWIKSQVSLFLAVYRKRSKYITYAIDHAQVTIHVEREDIWRYQIINWLPSSSNCAKCPEICAVYHIVAKFGTVHQLDYITFQTRPKYSQKSSKIALLIDQIQWRVREYRERVDVPWRSCVPWRNQRGGGRRSWRRCLGNGRFPRRIVLRGKQCAWVRARRGGVCYCCHEAWQVGA